MIKDIISEHLRNNSEQLTDLCKVYEKYGSDKSTWHNYSSLYSKIFSLFKNKSINFLEVGLGTNYTDIPSNMGSTGKPGASLYAISEMYPLWNIVGLDVDKRVLFQDSEKRISTFFVDQTDSSTINELFNQDYFRDKKFNIILDDGLHDFSANKIFFENANRYLTDDGVYIIEDILSYQISFFENFLEPLKKQMLIDYFVVQLPHPKNKVDNNLIIIIKNS